MNIVGLGGSEYDFSSCLLQDGKIVSAVEEERLNRKKHSIGITDNEKLQNLSVKYCLEIAGIDESEVDLIIGNDILSDTFYKKYIDKIILINHHLSHASSSYFVSPFEESAILVVDGHGSSFTRKGKLVTETISSYYAEGNQIINKDKHFGLLNDNPLVIDNSLGWFYEKVGKPLGFNVTEEGKTMGLAPYGKETYIKEFERFYRTNDNGHFIHTHRQSKELRTFILKELENAKSSSEVFQIKADIAFSVQYHLEEVMIKLANYLYSVTKSSNLCIAGGVALNSVANYKIMEKTPFKNLFIQPAAGDNGTSIGSALYGYHVLNKQKRSDFEIFSPYLGKEYSENEILNALISMKNKIKFTKCENIEIEVSRLLSNSKIIGWFQGKSEIGPRALGNRSILCDARNPKMKKILNLRVKHREDFRPFAPLVLEEFQSDYFNISYPSYYMLLVSPIFSDKQAYIPAVTHVDGTGRIQTVTEHLNSKLHKLLKSFYDLTGTPVLLNTSFNDNGEPIVETPTDAINCFLKIDLDYLVIGNYLITKK